MTKPPTTAAAIARMFHETYERLAPSFGYETRRQSAVPWEQVPEQNKALMIAVAAEVASVLLADQADAILTAAERRADEAHNADFEPTEREALLQQAWGMKVAAGITRGSQPADTKDGA